MHAYNHISYFDFNLPVYILLRIIEFKGAACFLSDEKSLLPITGYLNP